MSKLLGIKWLYDKIMSEVESSAYWKDGEEIKVSKQVWNAFGAQYKKSIEKFAKENKIKLRIV